MTLEELRTKLRELTERIDAITAGAKAQGRDINDDEAGTIDGLLDERDTVKANVEKLEKAKAREERIAAAQAQMDDPQPRRASPTQPNETGRVDVVGERAEADPCRGFASHNEFLLTVIGEAQGNADDRLRPLATVGSDEQGTYSDPYGGYLVPEGFLPGFLSTSIPDDPIGGRTTRVPMATPVVNINARVDKDHSSSVSGGLTVSRREETGTGSASRMTTEKVKLEAHGLFGLAYASEELLSRSAVSFVSLLAQGFRDEFTSTLVKERLNGTGVGEYMGINNSPCLITVAKETGQAADTIVYENIIKMRARCWGYGNAVWMANQNCLPQLMLLNQTVGTAGTPVWQFSAREDHVDVLLGRPLVFSEYLASIGDVGDIILANWTQYLEGTLTPLQSAESIHVRFVNHERTFKFWMENDGAPWWRSSLTPVNGATLSPFVRLAAR